MQLNPTISIINRSNLKVTENTNNAYKNPVISQTNPCLKIGLYYRFKLKNNYFVNSGISFSNFNNKVSHIMNCSTANTSFESLNRCGTLDLSLSIMKEISLSGKTKMILDLGIGYCFILPLGGTSTFYFDWDSNITAFSMMTNAEWGSTVNTAEVHGGIKFRNRGILHNKLEYGLSYIWVISKIPGYSVTEFINNDHLSYSVNPNISSVSIDLIYSLFRRTDRIILNN